MNGDNYTRRAAQYKRYRNTVGQEQAAHDAHNPAPPPNGAFSGANATGSQSHRYLETHFQGPLSKAVKAGAKGIKKLVEKI